MRNLPHIPVTQDHSDAGHSATWQNPAGNVAVIPHEERVLSRSALDALLAAGESVAAVYAGFAVTTVELDDGRELAYYWCHDGITLMADCARGRTAAMAPQTVRLMDLLTYEAYCASRLTSNQGVLTMTIVVRERRRRGSSPRIDGLAPSDPCPSDVRVGKPIRVDLQRHLSSFRNFGAMTLTSAA